MIENQLSLTWSPAMPTPRLLRPVGSTRFRGADYCKGWCRQRKQRLGVNAVTSVVIGVYQSTRVRWLTNAVGRREMQSGS